MTTSRKGPAKAPVRKAKFVAPPGVKITSEELFAADLTILPEAQRAFLPAHAAKLRREWDPLKVGVLEVARLKDGRLIVMDGQHRYRVALDLDETAVLMCVVYEGLTGKQIAEKFMAANKGRRPVHQYDLFRVEVTAEDPEALAMLDGVTRMGMKMSYATSTNVIGAIQAVRAAAKAGGSDLVADTIMVLDKGFGRHPSTWDSMVFRAVAMTIHRNRSNIDLMRLAHTLEKSTVAQWKAGAAGAIVGGGGSNSRSLRLMPLIVAKYNSGLRRPANMIG